MTDMPTKDYAASSRRMAIKAKGGKWAPHAVRLRILRVAIFNENSRRFAARLRVSPARLSNMENGYPLSIDVANKIRFAVPGMTLDWLFHGEERALPMEIVMRLRAEAAKEEYRQPH